MATKTEGAVFRNEEQGKKLVDATTEFAWDLFKEISKSNGGENVFFSPASISLALGMTYLGAKGETAAQMAQTMKLKGVDEKHVHPSFSDIIQTLGKSEGSYKLHTANRLYAQQGYKFLTEFLDATKSHYLAGLEDVDYVKDTEGARQLINKWVEDQTVQKIKDLIPSGVLNALTRLVLVNAIYFKGDWMNKFKEEDTKKEKFYADDDSTVDVDLMYQEEKFNFGYNSEMSCKAIELPYKGKSLSMFLLLPNNKGGVEAVQKSLTLEQLANVRDTFKMREMKVHTYLPKFRMEQSVSLSDLLKAMGMKDVFDVSKADLSGVDGGKNLFVSHVLHKAFIEVNEEGSEAAAATAAIMMMRSLPKRIEFKADRPFLFFIQDNRTGTILFLGKMVKPDGASSGKEEL